MFYKNIKKKKIYVTITYKSYYHKFEGDYMSVDMSVKVHGITFKNPILTAASTPTAGKVEILLKAAKFGVGGLVTKTISSKPAKVKKPAIEPLFTKTNGKKLYAMLNCELWSEEPYTYWTDGGYQRLKETGLPIIASMGYTAQDLKLLAPLAEKAGVDAIEFSTHYVKYDPKPLVEIAKAIKESVNIPTLIKVSPHTPNVKEFVKALDPYVDGYVAINTLGPALHINIERKRPLLGAGYGWLSGPAIKPLAIRIVADIAKTSKKPIIGVGGIATGEDVIEYFMVGASAVQICTTAIVEGPRIYQRVLNEAESWLKKHNYSSINEIKGVALENIPE